MKDNERLYKRLVLFIIILIISIISCRVLFADEVKLLIDKEIYKKEIPEDYNGCKQLLLEIANYYNELSALNTKSREEYNKLIDLSHNELSKTSNIVTDLIKKQEDDLIKIENFKYKERLNNINLRFGYLFNDYHNIILSFNYVRHIGFLNIGGDIGLGFNNSKTNLLGPYVAFQLGYNF